MRYWLPALTALTLAGCGGGDGEGSRQTVTGPVTTITCARLTGPVTITNTTTVNCPTDSGNTTTTPPPEPAK
jgi:hypothetical protein